MALPTGCLQTLSLHQGFLRYLPTLTRRPPTSCLLVLWSSPPRFCPCHVTHTAFAELPILQKPTDIFSPHLISQRHLTQSATPSFWIHSLLLYFMIVPCFPSPSYPPSHQIEAFLGAWAWAYTLFLLCSPQVAAAPPVLLSLLFRVSDLVPSCLFYVSS